MPPRRASPDLAAAMLRFIDLLAFSSHSNAARRRFETATGVPLSRSAITTVDALSQRSWTGSELAEAVGVDAAQSSRQVASLVAAGYVRKRSYPHDRRRVHMELTETGRALVDRWQASWLHEVRRPLEAWAEEEVVAFERWMLEVHRRLRPRLVPERGDPDDPQMLSPATDVWAGRSEVAACLRAIADLVSLVGRMDLGDSLRALGLDLARHQYFVLHDVGTFGPTQAMAIAQRLDVNQSTISRAADGLRTAGLVERSAELADRRGRPLAVTAHGRRVLDDARALRLDSLCRLFADVGDVRAKRYAELTTRYLADLLTTADHAAVRYI